MLVVYGVLFPFELTSGFISSSLLLAGMPIIAALVAAWPLRLGSSTFGLAEVFAKTFLSALLLWLAFQLLTLVGWASMPSFWVMTALWLFVSVFVIWGFWGGYPEPRTGKQRVFAISLVAAVSTVTAALTDNDEAFLAVSAEVQPWLNPERPGTFGEEYSIGPEIEADRLWEAQPGLLRMALEELQPPLAEQRNVYGLAIAAQGTQTLFSREAKAALETLSTRFHSDFRGGVLVSNAADDLLHTPLATSGNISEASKGIARVSDPSKDLLIVFLTSHGGRDAALTSELPDYQPVTPISASAVAAALDSAGINRRVVIVSACYSGSWIAPLANEDTIVITAAAFDRTSFGCSDDRSLTFFGEAFLKGPLLKGGSLKAAFDSARRTIAEWEARDGLTPSNPQAFVGKNMQSLWTESAH